LSCILLQFNLKNIFRRIYESSTPALIVITELNIMKTFAKTRPYRHRSTLFVATFVWINVVSLNSVFPAIIYSGPQNLSLEGILNTSQALFIDLAGDTAGTWDNLKLSIASGSFGSVGSNDVIPSAEVALASTFISFPLVQKLDFGDPYPSNPIFGSGSKILWQFNPGASLDIGEFKDVTGYAAVQFGTFGGPQYLGWLQLSVENYSSLGDPLSKLTVIDWAYSDVIGERIAIGQIAEPSTFSLFFLGLFIFVIYNLSMRLKPKHRMARIRFHVLLRRIDHASY